MMLKNMRITIKKDIKINSSTILYKNTEATLVAVTWTDTDSDKYLIQIKDVRYLIDKSNADLN